MLDIISAYSYDTSIKTSETNLTFKEVYEKFLKWEIIDILDQTADADKIRKLKSQKRCLKAAFGNCSALHEKTFGLITYDDITEDKYIHPEIEDLRKEIKKYSCY